MLEKQLIQYKNVDKSIADFQEESVQTDLYTKQCVSMN